MEYRTPYKSSLSKQHLIVQMGKKQKVKNTNKPGNTELSKLNNSFQESFSENLVVTGSRFKIRRSIQLVTLANRRSKFNKIPNPPPTSPSINITKNVFNFNKRNVYL
ncbi:hypothetical protein SNEBB_007562 [Seison nebaliae]|nr:hypothetical protein SNEBB_007562 [Seison nebaliae]